MTWDLFRPLEAGGLTTLRVRHDWRTGRTLFLAGREWGPDTDFRGYRKAFEHESALTSAPAVLDDDATRALYGAHGAGAALADVHALVTAGRHQGVDVWWHGRRRIAFLSNMHSSVLGVANGRHAIRAGGIRRHDVEDGQHEVLVDGLNLARAMTFKNAAARIPYGGSKICVVSEPIGLDDLEALGFLAWCIDRSRCFTGPDMGLVPEHADVLRAHFTRNIVGGPAGALGPTGTPTAMGLVLALREAATRHLGRPLSAATVAVQGLGAVGEPLARALLEEGVPRLLVADVRAGLAEAFAGRVSVEAAARVEVADPDAILRAEVDVVSPNACGGVLGAEEIDALRCRVVMGAANNQLQASSQAEELALAERLAARGVLYQVDWMHNTAGVIAGYEEYVHQEAASMARVEARLAEVCGDGVRENLSAARRAGITPTAMAYQAIERRIYRG